MYGRQLALAILTELYFLTECKSWGITRGRGFNGVTYCNPARPAVSIAIRTASVLPLTEGLPIHDAARPIVYLQLCQVIQGDLRLTRTAEAEDPVNP